ncbi:heavy metal-associated isoprenylated plant protein 19 [Cucurbita maxima]|uniref:Heavy metal-associated isoprenylated plant protein 19 n=1 Tax=Cucurbita maxima TaxID=3661 RepID=A0A6J1KYZ9_CUCMA|nr:heavy metal-associated isoprenylated plant protein 19 [Cucurbita maxima]
MEKKKKTEEIKPLTAEFKVSMHCKACERTVAKAISKFKGVEKFMTDMGKHKVVVMGKFDPQKVVKKLRKKTRKPVELVVDKGAMAKEATVAKDPERSDPNNSNQVMMFNCCKESAQLLVLFSDENPNACCMM